MKLNTTILMLRILQWVTFFALWYLIWSAFRSSAAPLGVTDVVVWAVLITGSYVTAKHTGGFIMAAIIYLSHREEEFEKMQEEISQIINASK